MAPDAIVEAEQAKLAPLPPPEPIGERPIRRRYVTVAEVERYGGTEGCNTCTLIAMGHQGKRDPHSEKCRQRFEALWAADDSATARAKEEAYRLRANLPERSRSYY